MAGSGFKSTSAWTANGQKRNRLAGQLLVFRLDSGHGPARSGRGDIQECRTAVEIGKLFEAPFLLLRGLLFVQLLLHIGQLFVHVRPHFGQVFVQGLQHRQCFLCIRTDSPDGEYGRPHVQHVALRDELGEQGNAGRRRGADHRQRQDCFALIFRFVVFLGDFDQRGNQGLGDPRKIDVRVGFGSRGFRNGNLGKGQGRPVVGFVVAQRSDQERDGHGARPRQGFQRLHANNEILVLQRPLQQAHRDRGIGTDHPDRLEGLAADRLISVDGRSDQGPHGDRRLFRTDHPQGMRGAGTNGGRAVAQQLHQQGNGPLDLASFKPQAVNRLDPGLFVARLGGFQQVRTAWIRGYREGPQGQENQECTADEMESHSLLHFMLFMLYAC